LVVPDGVTITAASSLGGAPSSTFFDGNNIGMATIDGYLVTETLGSLVSLAAPSAATNSDIFTFTVNGNPTSGELKILENNSALATTITALKSFMQADMIDNGSAQFVNVVDPNAAAVSGMFSFNFSTLSVANNELTDFYVYPNPVSNIAHIDFASNNFQKAEVYGLQGEKLLESEETTIDVSNLSSGFYLLKIYANNGKSAVKRLMKN
jgi:hypothetical protein